MSTASRFRGSARRRVKHFGTGMIATRRMRSTLENPVTGTALTALAVNGTTASGATSINLDAANVRGKLPAGCQLTFASGPSPVLTTADATANDNALASVAIEALDAEAADDTVVTVSVTSVTKDYKTKRSSFQTDEIDGERIQLRDYKLELATSDDIDPEEGEWTLDSETDRLIGVWPHSPGTEQASVILHCRG